MDGAGTYYIAHGTKENKGEAKYEGEFLNNQREGLGHYEWTGKHEWYHGEYVKGKREGFGTYRHEDGQKYEGTWKAGQKHGEGVITKDNGEQWKGTWNEGTRVGELTKL